MLKVWSSVMFVIDLSKKGMLQHKKRVHCALHVVRNPKQEQIMKDIAEYMKGSLFLNHLMS